MAEKGDWRLQGQEKYLKNATLYYEKYRIPQKDWDHDHCEFCSKKFCMDDKTDCENEGYTTEDYYRWICTDCFNDFKERFNWNVEKRN